MSSEPYFRTELRPTERFSISETQKVTDLDAAYAGLKAVSDQQGHSWSGWKLGGTNHATVKAFSVSELYFGPLHNSEILEQPNAAPLADLCQVQGEVEISLRINADGTGYDAWCVSLEMPASAIENLPGAGVEALIADRCGAGALLLGPIHDGTLPDLSTAKFAIVQDGETLSESGLESLVAAPDVILGQFLALAKKLGYAVSPGDWVATGGITACCPFTLGSEVAIQRDGSDELRFQVKAS